MTPSTLAEWLAHLESLHPRGEAGIELGLERVLRVLDRLAAPRPGVVITVGGTNGKGSTCAFIEAMLRAAGYRAGAYASPHLIAYNERVRLDGRPVDDGTLCAAFARVEAARGDVPLTYFEFGTLAAWLILGEAGVDAAVLEVGLGGRLDAVNAIDPDCAVVTTVDLDHMDYLGPTREAIGYEKAGIFRTGRPAIVGDAGPPQSLLDHAAAIGADLRLIGRDFGYAAADGQWQWWGREGGCERRRSGLAHPALRGRYQLANASCALAALEAVRERLPLTMQAVREGLAAAALPGRLQVLPGRPQVVLDVAHNPQAARLLAAQLPDLGFAARTLAVFGMYRDKDMRAVAAALAPAVDVWHLASLSGPRAADAEELAEIVRELGAGGVIHCHAGPEAAFAAARREAGENDRILAFGSFITVAGVLRASGRA